MLGRSIGINPMRLAEKMPLADAGYLHDQFHKMRVSSTVEKSKAAG
jgi:hypothetical protein